MKVNVRDWLVNDNDSWKVASRKIIEDYVKMSPSYYRPYYNSYLNSASTTNTTTATDYWGVATGGGTGSGWITKVDWNMGVASSSPDLVLTVKAAGDSTYSSILGAYNSQLPVTWEIGDEAVEMKPAPRRPAPKDFNKYINASDLLEEFIRYLGTQRVRSNEVLKLPLDLFVKFLIIRACEEDQEEPNVTLELPKRERAPHCLGCGRFMRKDCPVQFHDPRCAQFYFTRQEGSNRLGAESQLIGMGDRSDHGDKRIGGQGRGRRGAASPQFGDHGDYGTPQAKLPFRVGSDRPNGHPGLRPDVVAT